MSIKDTMVGARESALLRLSETKIDRTAKENDELKTENRLLRDELAENRSERKQVLDLLDSARISVSEPPKHQFKLLRLVAVGGAIYAVATKTGAVDRVKEWIDTMRAKTEQFGSDLASKTSEMTHVVGDVVEHTGRKVEQAGESIEQVAHTTEK